MRRLEEQGAIFVRELDEIPTGATAVFSAHGVAPVVHEQALRRSLRVVDATCPLVTKVHSEVRHFAARGYTVVLIGHAGHDEIEGTSGEAPHAVVLVERVADVERLAVADDAKLAYVTQTTLSLDDTAAIVGALRERFPLIVGPRREDICYATTNRQRAVKALAREVDLVLVVGSANSSNSNRLAEVASTTGTSARLIDDERDIEPGWLEDREVVGVTSGASTAESTLRGVVEWFRRRNGLEVVFAPEVREDVAFNLPPPVRLGAR